MAISTKFINSDNIKVFPCGGRNSNYDVTSKLTTEYNLVSIINRLVDQKSFVVSDKLPAEGNDFLFNIGGYLFGTSDLTFGGLTGNKSEGSYIAAHIKPDNYIDNNGLTYTQLSPLSATVTITRDSENNITSTYGDFLDTKDGFTGIEFVLIPQTSIPHVKAKDKVLTVNKHTFEYTPRSSNVAADGVIAVTKTQLPLLQYNGSSWVIPQDSKIKFRTTTDGSHRSVAIDDGKLS